MSIMRGDLFSACLDPVVGSEQGGIRPVLVVQNDVGNRYSPTVIVLAVTGQVNKNRLPTHVPIPAGTNGLAKDSVVLAEQIRTLDKRRLRENIGSLKPEEMQKVSQARMVSLYCRLCSMSASRITAASQEISRSRLASRTISQTAGLNQ